MRDSAPFDTNLFFLLSKPGKPDIFVRDRKDGAVFYTNRVLKDFKQYVLKLVRKLFRGQIEDRLQN